MAAEQQDITAVYISNDSDDPGEMIREAGEYLARCKGYMQGIQYSHGGDQHGCVVLYIRGHEPPAEGYTYENALLHAEQQIRELWQRDHDHLSYLKHVVKQHPDGEAIMAAYREMSGDPLEE